MDGTPQARPPSGPARARMKGSACEPDTSASDQLISGLLPIAVLAGAATAYRRLRPGLRITFALVLGVLGIVMGGSEAAYYGPKEGLSGDDYTGVLAVGGGLLLVGL